MAIREATREFVAAVQLFDAEDVKRTSLALYDIARTIIEMRKAEPLDPADDPTSGLLATRRRRRAAARGDAARDDQAVHRRRDGRAVRVHRQHRRAPGPATPTCRSSSARDPCLIPAAVDEYLRLLTPYRGFARTPTRDVEIGGRLIRKDEPVAARLRLGESRRERLPGARPVRPEPPEHRQARRLRRRAASLRRCAAGDADAADHAPGAARAHLGDRARRRGDDDRLAGVGHALRPGATDTFRPGMSRWTPAPDFDPLADDFVRDPHAVWARLRSRVPGRARCALGLLGAHALRRRPRRELAAGATSRARSASSSRRTRSRAAGRRCTSTRPSIRATAAR